MFEQLSLMKIGQAVTVFVIITDGKFIFSLKESLCLWRPQQATSIQAWPVICYLQFHWGTRSMLLWERCWLLNHFAHKLWFLSEEQCAGERGEALTLLTSFSSNGQCFNIFPVFWLWKANPYLSKQVVFTITTHSVLRACLMFAPLKIQPPLRNLYLIVHSVKF